MTDNNIIAVSLNCDTMQKFKNRAVKQGFTTNKYLIKLIEADLAADVNPAKDDTVSILEERCKYYYSIISDLTQAISYIKHLKFKNDQDDEIKRRFENIYNILAKINDEEKLLFVENYLVTNNKEDDDYDTFS